MRTNIIEITVSGKVGSGKTEVLEVIKNALNEHLGYPRTHAKIAGVIPDGAINEAKHTGQTTKNANTVFVLREEDA